MDHFRHSLSLLAALLILIGGLAHGFAGMSAGQSPAVTAISTDSDCDHCPGTDIAAESLCALTCAMATAILSDAPAYPVRATHVIAALRPAPATGRDSEPDPYPPRLLV